MLSGQWTQQKRLFCKDNHADTIVGSRVNEVRYHRFGHGKPAGRLVLKIQIVSQHGPREVQNQHDIDSGRLGFRPVASTLWAHQNENHQDQRSCPQIQQKGSDSGFPRPHDLLHRPVAGKPECCSSCPLSANQQGNGQEQQEPDEHGIVKPEKHRAQSCTVKPMRCNPIHSLSFPLGVWKPPVRFGLQRMDQHFMMIHWAFTCGIG